jgi:hypothetical protein
MFHIKAAGAAIIGLLAISATASSSAAANPCQPVNNINPCTIAYMPIEGEPKEAPVGSEITAVSVDPVLAVEHGSNLTCSQVSLGLTLQGNNLKNDPFMNNGSSVSDCSYGGVGATITIGDGFIGGWAFNGKSTITGPVTISASIDESAGTLQCAWSASKLKGGFNANGKPITVQTTNQKFTGSDPGCPTKAKLTATWSLTVQFPGGPTFPVVLG